MLCAQTHHVVAMIVQFQAPLDQLIGTDIAVH
jgi:hypothetical protein